jgi:hypothetical protein
VRPHAARPGEARALGVDRQHLGDLAAERLVHGAAELVRLVRADERLDRAAEAAAVDARGAAPAEEFLGHREGHHRGLLRGAADRHVLQVHGARRAGQGGRLEEGGHVVRLEGAEAGLHEALLPEVVQGAQRRPVAQGGADLPQAVQEVGLGDLGEDLPAERPRHRLHLLRHGRVVRGVGRVVRPHRDEAEREAVVGEVVVEAGHVRAPRTGEVHARDAAERHRHLVHEAAGLPEVVALRRLGEACEPGGVEGALGPEAVHRLRERELEGRRAREPGAHGDAAREVGVEAARGADPSPCHPRGEAADERGGRVPLAHARVELGEVDLDGVEPLARHAQEAVRTRREDALDVAPDRARDDGAALVVGVVAGDLRPSRRRDEQHPARRLPEPPAELLERPDAAVRRDLAHAAPPIRPGPPGPVVT